MLLNSLNKFRSSGFLKLYGMLEMCNRLGPEASACPSAVCDAAVACDADVACDAAVA